MYSKKACLQTCYKTITEISAKIYKQLHLNSSRWNAQEIIREDLKFIHRDFKFNRIVSKVQIAKWI